MCQICSLRYYYREKIQKSIGEVEDANISTLASVILEKARVNKEIDVELSPKESEIRGKSIRRRITFSSRGFTRCQHEFRFGRPL